MIAISVVIGAWIQVIILIITVVGLISVGYFVIKRNSLEVASETIQLWKQAAEGWQAKAELFTGQIRELHDRYKGEMDRLTEENAKLREEVAVLKVQVEELQKRDQSAVLKTLEEHEAAAHARYDSLELWIRERHEVEMRTIARLIELLEERQEGAVE